MKTKPWEKMSLSQFVLVNFQYEYTARDGRNVSIKPNERYILVAKTNDHWWHVRKDEVTNAFFIPAQYVTELPPENETIQPSSERDGEDTAKLVPPVSLAINDQQSVETADDKDGHRTFKFVTPSEQHNNKSFEKQQWEAKAEPGLDPCNLDKDAIQMDISQDGLTNSLSPVKGECTYAVSQRHVPKANSQRTATEPSVSPQNDLNDDIRMLIRAGWDPKIWDLKEEHMYESVGSVRESVVQDTKDSEKKVVEELTPVSPVSPSFTSPPLTPQQSPGSPTDIPRAFADKVQSSIIYSSPSMMITLERMLHAKLPRCEKMTFPLNFAT